MRRSVVNFLVHLCSFQDLQQLFAPSRNMSAYRQHLSAASSDPPVVPLFPVIKKDLTFIHEGNQTWADGLVNFEKLRMVAKEIRAVSKMASAPYVRSNMYSAIHFSFFTHMRVEMLVGVHTVYLR